MEGVRRNVVSLKRSASTTTIQAMDLAAFTNVARGMVRKYLTIRLPVLGNWGLKPKTAGAYQTTDQQCHHPERDVRSYLFHVVRTHYHLRGLTRAVRALWRPMRFKSWLKLTRFPLAINVVIVQPWRAHVGVQSHKKATFHPD